ncbi:MAG TPA: hypothetical protein VGE43_02830, partial [Acidimicrobiales bacterium]
MAVPGDVAVEQGQLEVVGAGEPVPVQLRPRLGIHEVVGLGHRLGAELGREAHLAGQGAGEAGEVSL